MVRRSVPRQFLHPWGIRPDFPCFRSGHSSLVLRVSLRTRGGSDGEFGWRRVADREASCLERGSGEAHSCGAAPE